LIHNENTRKPALADELTVVFLRGNGSPRTFRIPVLTLQRSLTAIGFLFCLSILAAVFFLALNFIRPAGDLMPAPMVAAPAPSTAPAPVPAGDSQAKPGIWQKISGGESSGENDSELKKEVDGLHQDIARLSAQIDGRKELNTGQSASLLQLFGPRSALMPEASTTMRVKNPKVTRDNASKDIILTFELHNVDPNQKQARGYIVALAKSADMLLVYPPNAFNPSQNIVLDFTKGETFGVSRFRAAQATFSAAALAGKKVTYQILLFSTDGRVIASQHVEEK
jgi:hypothetical protein